MIEFLIGAIVSIGSILIGYSMGKGSSIIPEETRKQIKRLFQSLPIKKDIGMVPRPTASDIERSENPLIKAEETEMSKTFSEIVPKP